LMAMAGALTATNPFSYLWTATDLTTQTQTNNFTDTIDLVWNSVGLKVITLTALNAASSIFATTTLTTTMFEACLPVTNVQLSRLPSADKISTKTAVRFAASASGTIPFSYVWKLNGILVTENRSTFEQTFAKSSTINVTVQNACSQESRTMEVMVEPFDPTKPDLSASYKTVNTTNAAVGDILTYTIVLRNISNVPAENVILSDPIPAGTERIDEVANRRMGETANEQFATSQPRNLADSQPRNLATSQTRNLDYSTDWTGSVIFGTPVVIQFAVKVLSETVINNVAMLTETETGRVITLSTQTAYNPDFKLSINNGDMYTNIPTVTLNYVWPISGNITHVKFSNDSGFDLIGEPDWLLPSGIYPDWPILSQGDFLMPRTVYARFRDDLGQQYGPIEANIIYDPILPIVKSVEITQPEPISQVTVRVTASDDNSGVKEIYLSDSPIFTEPIALASGAITAIPWTLSLAPDRVNGLVYVMVKDRAGNPSAVAEMRVVSPLTLTITSSTSTLTPILKPDESITLTAFINPNNTTLPLSYTWKATDQLAPIRLELAYFLTDTFSFSWPKKTTGGTKTITITARNIIGVVSNTYQLFIKSDNITYLPLIFKN